MKSKLYLLELINYDHYDALEDVHVEDRWIIGYFSDLTILERAIALCEERKETEEKICITEIPFDCSPNQKFVYVLFYEYSILEGTEYSDYYEYFEPKSSPKKCLEQKKILLKNKKYQTNGVRIYDDSIDGFRIDKILINFIAHINYKIN